MKARLFVDMDGTVAKFLPIKALEELYEPGRFSRLPVIESACNAVRAIVHRQHDMEVFILSAVLTDSKYALDEKNRWLDRWLPEIDSEHRVFPPCGENKADYISDGIRDTDFLLDDYSKNLIPWQQAGGQGIKLFNGINGTRGEWRGNAISYENEESSLEKAICGIVLQGHRIHDVNPNPAVQKLQMEAMAIEHLPEPDMGL